MLLASFGISSANIALPTLATAFDATFQAVQWVMLAYLLATSSSMIGVGRLGDLIGRCRLLQIGLLIFSVASAVCSLASTLLLVIIARAVQGIGAAIMITLTVALVSELGPKAKTGRAMGLLGTTSALGTALGPLLGGVLIDLLGWRAVFFINLPVCLVAFVFLRGALPPDRPPQPTGPGGFDGIGTVLLALTLVAYTLALARGREHFGTESIAFLAVAVLGLLLFWATERRASSPLLHLEVFRDTTLRARLIANMLVSTVLMTTLVVGPFYLSLALELDTSLVGLVMALGPSSAALSGIPTGHIVDRLGPHRTTLMGLRGILVGSLLVSTLVTILGVVGYIISIVVIAPSYALFQAANNTAVMRDVDPSLRGVLSGTLNLSRNLGLITGVSIMGAVFSSASGPLNITQASPDAIIASTRITFASGAFLILVAIAVMTGAHVIPTSRAPKTHTR